MLRFLFLLASLQFTLSIQAQLSGVKTVPGTYPNVSAAVADLNAQGVGPGGVVVEVAAGYTESVSDAISLSASGMAGQTIVFRKSGAGANPVITRTGLGNIITSVFGGNGDAVIVIEGGDHITFDQIDVATTSQGIEYGYLLRKTDGSNGCKNVTIKNAAITLNKGSSAYVAGIYSSNLVAASPANSSAGIPLTSVGGRHENISITGNTISNVFTGIILMGYNAPAPYDLYDHNMVVGSINEGNTIQNFAGNQSTTAYGIYAEGQNTVSVGYNTINNISGSGTPAISLLYGIYLASNYSSWRSVQNNFIDITSSSTTAAMNGIANGLLNTPGRSMDTAIINTNTIALSNTSTSTANYSYISNNMATSRLEISNNTFAGTVLNVNAGNLISNQYAVSTVSITGNSVSGTLNGGKSSIIGCNILTPTQRSVQNISNNNFSNIVLARYGIFTGINISSSGASTFDISGNTISNITAVGNAVGVTAINVTGISVSSADTCRIFGNKIVALSTQQTIRGIVVSGTTKKVHIYKNVIDNLTSVFGSIYGMSIFLSNYCEANIYNNGIANLHTTMQSALDAVRGISLESTGAGQYFNLYHNTVFLNNNPTPTTESTTVGLYHTASSNIRNGRLDLRNNIIINNSTPKGSGLAIAFKRAGANLENYATTSDNNLFYAGPPSANKVIYYDGTNTDQTLAEFKARVTTRDASSVSELPVFISTNGNSPSFLRIDPSIPSQVESAGAPVGGITDDIDGELRSMTNPDIGADEFAGTTNDITGPGIHFTSLRNTASVAQRTFAVKILDASGVATGVNAARIYFRKNGGAYASTVLVMDSGVSKNGSYTATINYALVGGVSAGDVIEYFVIAEDVAGTPNISSNPSGVSASSVNSITTPPVTPTTYTIVAGFSNVVNVGSGEAYTSLTNAGGLFEALNFQVLLGNLTINVTSNLTNETGTYSLNELLEEGGSGYSLTIQPSGGPRVVMGNNAAALINLNGADRIIIDGINTSATSLIIRNNNTLGAVVRFVNGATNNVIKNTTIEGNNTEPNSGLIVFTSSLYTAGNSNNIISNNLIRDRSDFTTTSFAFGIYCSEVPGIPFLPNASNVISGNSIFNFTNAGINLAFNGTGDNWKITGNSFFNDRPAPPASTLTGISVSGGSKHEISSNYIGGQTVNAGGNPLFNNGSFIGIKLLILGENGTIDLTNNTIGNIRLAAAGTGSFIGIYVTDERAISISSVIKISGNTIGHLTNANSIVNASGSSTTGIFWYWAKQAVIENNTIANLNATGTGTNVFLRGIWVNARSQDTIRNNHIKSLTSTGSPAITQTAALAGIYFVGSGSSIVTGNTISDLLANHPSAVNEVNGISLMGNADSLVNVTSNRIFNIQNSSSGTPYITGVKIISGSWNLLNNMISVDNGTRTNAANLRGVDDHGQPSGISNMLFNSVYIGGNASTGSASSFAYVRENGSPRVLRNNIFYNERIGGTGSHYAIGERNTTVGAQLSSDFNNLYSSNAATVGEWGTGLSRTFNQWKSSSGGDANSVNIVPIFQSTTDLHLNSWQNSSLENKGTPITGITTDIDDDVRNAIHPDIGADEYTGVLPVVLVGLKGEIFTASNKLSWTTLTETNNHGFELQRSADGQIFTKIGFELSKASNGNSTAILTYEFFDKAPLGLSNYYRLKQVDSDGKFTYSNTIFLRRQAASIFLANIYPNPAISNLNVTIDSPLNENLTLKITDITGKVFGSQSVQVLNGENKITIGINHLPVGQYILKVYCDCGNIEAVKFIKR